jgi:hypothetical protein
LLSLPRQPHALGIILPTVLLGDRRRRQRRRAVVGLHHGDQVPLDLRRAAVGDYLALIPSPDAAIINAVKVIRRLHETSMMQPDQLYALLQERPFQPMRVYLTDGRTYDIRFRELAVVGESWLDIGIPAPDEADAIADAIVTVPLEAIDRVERLSATASPTPY